MRRAGVLIPFFVLGYAGLAFGQAGQPAGPPATAPSVSAKPPAIPNTPDDAVEEVDASDEGPKPDASTGVITGKMTDVTGKEEIIDGQCAVVGTKLKGITDSEGRYSIKLPPGKYELRCFYEGYKTQRIENVVVTAGKKTVLDVKLASDKDKPVEEVVVEVDPDRSTPATQLFIRKSSATVSDAVSAQDMAKTPDRNAADATRRVVGASVVGGRFVFVRGLGDRYTNSLLNGTPLPSPEPDVQAIPLDIFPINVLSDITILKTFTPDMPGDFAGGSVRVQTKSFPSKFFINWSFTGGFNSQTTFTDRYTYDGSRQDWLGLDGGSRKLPTIVAQSGGKLDGNKEELEVYGQSFNQKGRRIYQSLTAPNYSMAVSTGNSHQVFGNTLGWILALNYGRRWSNRTEQQALYNFDQDASGRRILRPTFDFVGERSTETITLGGLGTVGYQIGQDHRVTATGLYSGSAEDDVLLLEGFEQDDATTQKVSRARWVQRQLYFGQMVGEHKFPSLKSALFKWNAFYGVAKRGEPNNVQSVYQLSPVDNRFGAVNDDGFTHFFSRQSEAMRGGGFDWTQPLTAATDKGAKIKLGGLITAKNRTFEARRFRYNRLRTPGIVEFLYTPPGDAVNNDSIGQFLEVEENTRSTDAYRANQQVYAGYFMADVPVTSKLRLIGGQRLEFTKLEIITRDDFIEGSPEVASGFKKADLLPGLSAMYALTEAMNLRFALSQTIARPQFREVAPFVYADFFNAQLVYGNPNLKRTLITNVDFRWEWFPAADEVVALSLFYKHFKDPIEAVGVIATSQIARTYQNAEAARNFGAELEARKNLKFLGSALAPFTFLGNFSAIDSRVKLTESENDKATTPERPLQGQSPFVLNLAVDYLNPTSKTRARLAYNVFGRRLQSAGNLDLPNIYEKPRHQLDLTVSQTLRKGIDLKLSIENLLNSPFVFKATDKITTSYRTGQTVWLTATYDY